MYAASRTGSIDQKFNPKKITWFYSDVSEEIKEKQRRVRIILVVSPKKK